MTISAQTAQGAPAAPIVGGALSQIARHRVLATLLFFAAFPFVMPYESVAINVLIYGLFAVGFNLLAYSTRWRTRFHADGGQCSSVMADTVPR